MTEKTLNFVGESDNQKYEATINLFADLDTEVKNFEKKKKPFNLLSSHISIWIIINAIYIYLIWLWFWSKKLFILKIERTFNEIYIFLQSKYYSGIK